MNKFTQNAVNKLPEITVLFWIMKICATTLGETAWDLFSMTLKIGYAVSSIILISLFFMTFFTQLKAKKFHPLLYWTVILTTSTAGTTMSDFMDRTLGLGYATGSMILITILVTVLLVWYFTQKSISVTNIKTPKVEFFYWTAILFSNTLGTAFGDFLADSSGLGFAGGAMLVSSLLILIYLAKKHTKISPVILFRLAFILTRPLWATVGDLFTKLPEKGGLGFWTIGSSLILFTILGGLIIYQYRHIMKNNKLMNNPLSINKPIID